MKEKFNYKKSIVIASLGNVIEWYDFAVFGYFSLIIGNVFFSRSVPMVALIKSFLVFSFGYLARPIGGVIFGFIGDKYDRKKALGISFFTMALSTVMMGLLPSFSQIGIVATLLLCTLRILQGLSAGGELVGLSTYTYEMVPCSNRGFWCSLNTMTSITGILLGSLVAAFFYHFFKSRFLLIYGWRIVFLFSIFLIIPAIFFFHRIAENNNFKSINLNFREHFYSIFKRHYLAVSGIFLINISMSVCFYIMFLWLPTYLGVISGQQFHHILGLNSVAILFLILLIPLAGYLSDRMGSLRLAIFSSLLILIFIYPLFALITKGSFSVVFFSQLVFCLMFCSIEATMPKIMAKQFPEELRFSGTAISYNISTSLFGGTAPLICTLIIVKTKVFIAPALYLMVCCFLGLCGYSLILFNRKRL